MNVILTGASGFVGAALRTEFKKHNWLLTTLGRGESGVVHHHAWQLGEVPRNVSFEGAILVHSAFATQWSGANLEALRGSMVEGSRTLFSEARRQGIKKIIFISSLSAHPSTQSEYGRAKYEVEKLMHASDLIVRPGLVVGNGGLFARMLRAFCHAPMLPLVDGGHQPIYTILLEDLVRAISELLGSDQSGLTVLASTRVQTLREFYSHLGKRLGRVPIKVPIASRFLSPIIRHIEAAGFHLPITSENLSGLAVPPVWPEGALNRGLSWEPRSICEAPDSLFNSKVDLR